MTDTDTDKIRATDQPEKDSTPEWWKNTRKNPALILAVAETDKKRAK